MYKKIKSRYDKGYIRIDQLKRYVELEIITQEQYETICGKEYLKGDENADTETDVSNIASETNGTEV